jgi:hypothetical protein
MVAASRDTVPCVFYNCNTSQMGGPSSAFQKVVPIYYGLSCLLLVFHGQVPWMVVSIMCADRGHKATKLLYPFDIALEGFWNPFMTECFRDAMIWCWAWKLALDTTPCARCAARILMRTPRRLANMIRHVSLWHSQCMHPIDAMDLCDVVVEKYTGKFVFR